MNKKVTSLLLFNNMLHSWKQSLTHFAVQSFNVSELKMRPRYYNAKSMY
jgi:hypothetical protein